ncbi:hypothetical protein BH24ACT21_BH24ACT21_09240 [soil metagenome]
MDDFSPSLDEGTQNGHAGIGSYLIDRTMAGAGMLRIEMRRSVCLWLFPILVTALCWIIYDGLPAGIWLWPDTVSSIQASILLYGPLAGGLAAWAAGREQRRNLTNLLSTTSRPETARDLAIWAATTVWCGLAYGLAVLVFFSLTYFNATWGSPDTWPVLAGLLAIIPHAALGYAAGRWVPSRFTAPLVAVVLYGLQGIFMFNLESSARYLAPYGPDPGASSVFYETSLNVYAPQSVWFVGLAALALATLGLKGRRNLGSWAALALAATVTVLGAVLLLRMPPPAVADERETLVPYEHVCEEGLVPVCVHPAYETALPETVALVDDLVGSLVSLPGAPERAEQRGRNAAPARLLSDGTLVFDLRGGFDRWNASMGVSFRDYMEADIAQSLVSDDMGYVGEDPRFYSDDPCAKLGGSAYQARLAVMSWLLWQTGRYDSMESESFTDSVNDILCPRTKAAIERFDSLKSTERREWLEKNYADLRAGDVTLDDLP